MIFYPNRSSNKNHATKKLGRYFFQYGYKKYPHRITKILNTIFNISVLLLLAFMGFQTFKRIHNDNPGPVSSGSFTAKVISPIKNESLSSPPALSDYKAIWKRNLFKSRSETLSLPQKEINFADVEDADKKLGLKLIGTVVANVSTNRFAIIENTQGQNIYHEGDTTGSFVIKKILRNNVIIATNDGDKFLALKSDDFSRQVASTSSSLSLSVASKPRRSGVRFKTVELPTEEIMAAFNDIDRLIEEVGTSSYKFGKLSGFEIGSVSDGSILKKIGLRSHDKILALNEKTIEDESEAFKFFEKIADGEKLTIKFRRRNRTRRIELNPI